MSLNYRDKWTRWHDKPTTNGNHSSNNGWLYTAFSKHLRPGEFDHGLLMQCFKECRAKNFYNRSPGEPLPPISKDEVIGMTALGFLSDYDLKGRNWNFCNLDYYEPIYNFSFGVLLNSIKEMWRIRKFGRNYFWQNKIIDVYHLAFSLSPQHRYFFQKKNNQKVNLFYGFIFFLNIFLVYFKGNKSSRMVLWLELKEIHPGLAKLIPIKKWLYDYFDFGHPFLMK